jgi:dephospho-CoA kinase
VVDADQIARQVTAAQSPVLKKIVAHFGSQILGSDGQLDRHQLGRMIFTDSNARKWLEKLLHPLIQQQAKKQLNQATSTYAIYAAPLLVETQAYRQVQRILVVDAPEQQQLSRARQRGHYNDAKIKAIINAQHSRQQRLAHADDILLNNADIPSLRQKVIKLHGLYLDLAQRAK